MRKIQEVIQDISKLRWSATDTHNKILALMDKEKAEKRELQALLDELDTINSFTPKKDKKEQK